MNKLGTNERARIVAALVEGNSLRSITRMTGTHRTTIMKLLCDLGAACGEYQNKVFTNLQSERIECDEIWSFVGAKEKNATPSQKQDGWGDVWTWVALDAESKLVPCWHVGTRDADSAHCFMEDLASRLAKRVQLTTDGHRAYLTAVENAFGSEIDYAMLVKIYGQLEKGKSSDVRYSPAAYTGAKKTPITGNPEIEKVSTSYVERQNLTMRMGMRRFTRLTNAFSKKIENHCHAISLHYMHYNFCRVHKTLKTTPAIAAGVETKVWGLTNLIELID